jgi:Flp pilus assembly protein TadD
LTFWALSGLVASLPLGFLGWWFLDPGMGAQEGLDRDPANVVARGMEVDRLCEKAYAHVSAERFADAFDVLTQAVRLDPGDPRPYMGLGEVCRKLDYDQRAEDYYRKAVEVDPKSNAAKVSLSMVLCDFGKNREAIEILEEVEKEKPKDPFVWAELAINAIHLGSPKEAIPLLERYNATQGRQAWGYENLGRAYAEAGEAVKAEKAYREAIEINPKTALAHLWLGQLLITLGRRAEAEGFLGTFRQLREWQTQARFLEQGVNRSPDDVMMLVRLAHVRTLLGQDREALVPLERALKLAPGDDRIRKLYESVRQKVQSPSK